jgi:hypothetical protein
MLGSFLIGMLGGVSFNLVKNSETFFKLKCKVGELKDFGYGSALRLASNVGHFVGGKRGEQKNKASKTVEVANTPTEVDSQQSGC